MKYNHKKNRTDEVVLLHTLQDENYYLKSISVYLNGFYIHTLEYKNFLNTIKNKTVNSEKEKNCSQ